MNYSGEIFFNSSSIEYIQYNKIWYGMNMITPRLKYSSYFEKQSPKVVL